jgi:hypothetical protein
MRNGEEMKELYVVEYESARWAEAPSHCVVWANSEDDAIDKATPHAEETLAEQYSDHEYEGDGDDPHATINFAEVLKGSEFEEYYADEVQRLNFYPCVNPEDAV